MDLLKKTQSSQRPSTDRFVATRESFEDLRWRHHVKPVCQPTFGIWYGKYVKQNKYASHIDKAFGLEPRAPAEKPEQTWPCVPRTRSHFSSTGTILALPKYSTAAFPEILDWSKDNILVSALGHYYHKWSWHSQSHMGKGFTVFNTACCRFDPTGERLALGTDMQRVEIHNAWSKWVAGGRCRCVSLAQQFCLVTAVDWSPTGNSFATGCSRGMVTSFDRDGILISRRQYPNGAISLIRVSPDARYVAAAAVNNPQVRVMLWPALIEVRSMGSDWIVKTLAWHPWRSALLGIGGVTDQESWVGIWDAPRNSPRGPTAVSNSHFSLDAMLFSHLTGELLLSLGNKEQDLLDPKGSSQLVVMSGSDTVVDQWAEGQYGMDRVRTMVFSPDGTKLAAATADEDLIILNFLPQDKKPMKKTKRRNFSAMPTYIDQSTHGFSLR